MSAHPKSANNPQSIDMLDTQADRYEKLKRSWYTRHIAKDGAGMEKQSRRILDAQTNT